MMGRSPPGTLHVVDIDDSPSHSTVTFAAVNFRVCLLPEFRPSTYRFRKRARFTRCVDVRTDQVVVVVGGGTRTGDTTAARRGAAASTPHTATGRAEIADRIARFAIVWRGRGWATGDCEG